MPEKERILNLLIRKLAGEASKAEAEEMELLLEKHPGFRHTCLQAEDFWKKNQPADTDFLEATWLLHLMRLEEKGYYLPTREEQRIAGTRKPARRRAWLFVLPVIAVTAGMALVFQNRGTNKPAAEPVASAAPAAKVEVSTKNGHRSKIQLPDGSQVWLNAGSKLDYDKSFGGQLREVYLNGEAFFDVVHNEQLPFIVHTSIADIKVLGTAFNVRSYTADATTETSLIRGSVEVLDKKSSEKWILKPNQKLVLQNRPVQLQGDVAAREVAVAAGKQQGAVVTKLTYEPADTIPMETAWIDDKLYLAEEPFSEVAKRLERRYDVHFEFRNSNSGQLMIHGIFRNETLQQAMEALQFSFGFRYAIENKKVIIY